MTVSLTVVVPTVGRPSLRSVLADLAAELRDRDEILVVGDGPQPDAARIVDEMAPRAEAAIRYFQTEPTRCSGNRQRQAALARARGSHVLFVDDDDRIVQGVMPIVCETLKHAPDRPYLFRMWHTSGLIWRDPVVREGNVGSQSIAFPNRADRLGVWGDRYEGDFDFIASTLALYPKNSVVWSQVPVVVHGFKGVLAPCPPGSIRPSK